MSQAMAEEMASQVFVESGFHAVGAKIYHMPQIGGFTRNVPLRATVIDTAYKSFEWTGSTVGWALPAMGAEVRMTSFRLALSYEDNDYGRDRIYRYRLECVVEDPRAICSKVGGSETQFVVFSLKDQDNGSGIELHHLWLNPMFTRRTLTQLDTGARVMSWSSPPDPKTVFERTKSVAVLPLIADYLSVHIKP